jgi:hypothetical protein
MTKEYKVNKSKSRRLNNAWQWLALITLLSIFALPARAAVPDNIDYQGYLTDTGGAPLTRTVFISFSLYNVDAGGVPLWNNIQSVTVTNGLFTVQLGNGTFPVDMFDNPLWLGIDVAADGEMSPRTALTSAAFAFKADDALTLEGQSALDLDQSAHTTDAANPHGVSAAQIGAADAATVGAHTSNITNPHSVTAAQTGAISGVELANHAGNLSAHHTRYADSEAVSAILAADGASSTLDADTLDGLNGADLALSATTYTKSEVDAIVTSSVDTAVASMQTQITALQDLLQHFTRSGDDVYVTGANLHVLSGSGSTAGTVNGRGNLIVGYNEVRTSGALSCSLGAYTNQTDCTTNSGTWAISHKTGSHNIVTGYQHNYSRYGGLVAGSSNTISGTYATVSGGVLNSASGSRSSVSGGNNNTAYAIYSAISGGESNLAGNGACTENGICTGSGSTSIGQSSTISGGYQNKTIGYRSSVSGGTSNIASAHTSSVSGGSANTASGEASSVSGGISNTATEYTSSVSGGSTNTASGRSSSVSGGLSNTATVHTSSVSGGSKNTASGSSSSVSGGFYNAASGEVSSVSGGVDRESAGIEDWRAGGLFQDY